MSGSGRTVLITGASSGIGLEAALLFVERGWNVVATMRRPEGRTTPLHGTAADLVHLDVVERDSIAAAVRHTLDAYGGIDVLVNNAGYAVYGPFESTTDEQVARQFDTNVFGLFDVTRAVLPVLRSRRSGVLINVASFGGRAGFPLYTLYNASKWAIEGFSEALVYELRPLGIRVKLIEPGVIRTEFYGRSLDVADGAGICPEYRGVQDRCRRNLEGGGIRGTTAPRAVAETIYRAATDGSWRLRYLVGSDARQGSALRRLLPDGAFRTVIGNAVMK